MPLGTEELVGPISTTDRLYRKECKVTEGWWMSCKHSWSPTPPRIPFWSICLSMIYTSLAAVFSCVDVTQHWNSYLRHRSPNPSRGWIVPLEDSPWQTNSTDGLYFSMPWGFNNNKEWNEWKQNRWGHNSVEFSKCNYFKVTPSFNCDGHENKKTKIDLLMLNMHSTHAGLQITLQPGRHVRSLTFCH